MEKNFASGYSAPGIAAPPGHAYNTSASPGHAYASAPGIAPPPPGMTYSSPAPTAMRAFGPTSQVVICPSCNHRTPTTVKAESSSKTHLMAGLLCLACCCCIPYCVDSCKSRNHYCQSCGAYLGTFAN